MNLLVCKDQVINEVMFTFLFTPYSIKLTVKDMKPWQHSLNYENAVNNFEEVALLDRAILLAEEDLGYII